jgi:translation initiation factor IF-3
LRVIASDGSQLGIITRDQALDIAREEGLDLVEVAPNANPPVAKILDYGKYKYQQEKRAKESKKKAHTITVKEVKVRPKIGQHDLDTKKKHITEFLEAGNKVKVTMQFRGREIVYAENGKAILDQIVKDFEEIGSPEAPPKMEGRFMGVILAPKKTEKK